MSHCGRCCLHHGWRKTGDIGQEGGGGGQEPLEIGGGGGGQ